MKLQRITTHLALAALLGVVSAQVTTTPTPAAATPTANITATAASTTPAPTFNLPLGTGAAGPVPTSPATPGNSTLQSCPGPLIPNTRGLTISTCTGSCCIKCPAVNSFYPPNTIERVLTAAYGIRQVSLALSIFMAISYALLPGKRNQPHISVMFLTISLAFWYAAFDVMPGVTNACVNDFEQSTGHNSTLCGIQGVLIVYLTQTSSIWCCVLIMKLHLLAVWRSDFIDRHYGWLTGFTWIFPLAFAIPVAVKNYSQYPGVGFSCMVSTDRLNTFLFYPLAVIIYPSMVCHTITVARMIRLAMMSSKVDGMSELSSNARMHLTATMQAKRLLRGQWRPALMLATLMSSFTIFWLFYFVDARRLNNIGPATPWVQQWVLCVMTSGANGLTSDETQTACSRAISSNLFSVQWFAAAEIFLALIGAIVALVFVSKREFWSDWAFMLTSVFSRGKLGTSSHGHGSSHGGNKSPDMDQAPPRPTYNVQANNKRPSSGINDSIVTTFPQERKWSDIHFGADGSQWYNMDELFDKEYDIQASDLNRSTGYAYPNEQLMEDPPHRLASTSDDPRFGDILYTPPAQESDIINSAWTPSATTLVAGSSRTHLVANHQSERYIEQPVFPKPVPRANTKPKDNQGQTGQQSQQVFLSTPSRTGSPTFAQISLSPMPPKLAGQSSASSPRPSQPDSVLIWHGKCIGRSGGEDYGCFSGEFRTNIKSRAATAAVKRGFRSREDEVEG
ncbi:hypothetical protein BGZ99_000410 [Dissophora globulifera]|uniref:G-protein coupled receptors family 2 profile 2 domain-containing protein n=1 Tax=Dissophora globulifera TaxID=979702 RepID=A0A9P6R3F8_9FUNG|nr:hypothetical protein BGZ99_000410 [Dissophora globulifera]